ncbi:Fc.00g115690.m01.CDS01 [Cosmosporella sp. VM-42]
MDLSGAPLLSRPRQKRAQVVRACDSCRQHRIKCDNYIPCFNCKNRGEKCSNAAVKSIALPDAYREIERLRKKVQELESELQQERNTTTNLDRRLPKPTTLSRQELSASQASGCRYGNPREGIHIRAVRSENETWYGASSLFYFIGRISNFLSSSLQQTHSTDQLLDLNTTSTLLDGKIASAADHTPSDHTEEGLVTGADGHYLSLMQEEYFLDLYWQSYHTTWFPILNEASFKEHYRSLWATGGDVRTPSALVDIVIALCMQYGVSMLPSTRQKLFMDDRDDATVAGRWYYLRCQRLLAYELESPSISTLQCQILCSIYLCCGTFQNMADSYCGMAVRTAYMLGIHLDPPESMSMKDRELRRRLWWALYVLDSKVGMKLGRPFLLHQSKVTPRLPGQNFEIAMQSGSGFSPLGDNVTWLSFNLEHAKLFRAARTAYTAFYGRDLDTQSAGSDVAVSEKDAEFLESCMMETGKWANDVPGVLKTKRKNNGHSFSTDGSGLDIEQFAPLWLQRQRLLLELIYHHLCTNLYRPFICFDPEQSSIKADKAAIKSALHSIALTNILHQVFSSTSVLNGWCEVFQWQWNAAMTLVGFVLAYPDGVTTAAARSGIDLAVVVLDIYGKSITVAKSAANIIRNLATKVDIFTQHRPGKQTSLMGNKKAEEKIPIGYGTLTPDASQVSDGVESGLMFDDLNTASLQNVFNMAFDVDHWTDLNMLWPNGGNDFLSDYPM